MQHATIKGQAAEFMRNELADPQARALVASAIDRLSSRDAEQLQKASKRERARKPVPYGAAGRLLTADGALVARLRYLLLHGDVEQRARWVEAGLFDLLPDPFTHREVRAALDFEVGRLAVELQAVRERVVEHVMST